MGKGKPHPMPQANKLKARNNHGHTTITMKCSPFDNGVLQWAKSLFDRGPFMV